MAPAAHPHYSDSSSIPVHYIDSWIILLFCVQQELFIACYISIVCIFQFPLSVSDNRPAPHSISTSTNISDDHQTKPPMLRETTATKPKSLSLDMERLPDRKPLTPTEAGAPAPPLRRLGQGRRSGGVLAAHDTKVFVVWLESFEDHEHFPTSKWQSTQMGHNHLSSQLHVREACWHQKPKRVS